MANERRNRIAEVIVQARISAIIRTTDQTLASNAIEACINGGFRVVEFTLTTPGAMALIEDFAQCHGLTVGAGTVLSPQQARDAVAAGAQFLVSPIVDSQVIAEAAQLDVPVIPGAQTPTEMETAHRLGADFVKVFPAPAGGVTFIETVRAPLPHLRLFPTAGITFDNFIDYLDAGCAGVGFTYYLFDRMDLAAGDFEAIRQRAARITGRLAQWQRAC
jgi:2-dehydro-3-deoxyphosphogluconate aldolase/(4S)-4-hydroxy-2-oxoglutarate aldolase